MYDSNINKRIHYSGMATGKRLPEIYTLSANLDSNGDNIIDDSEKGLITQDVGPTKTKSFIPLITNSITLFRILVVITLLGMATLGGFVGTFGCKGEYLQIKRGWVSQFALFCIILVNMFTMEEDSEIKDSSTFGIILGAFLTWCILNIVAKVGDSWLIFASPFWPTPLTYWGGVMLICVTIYALDQHRRYWIETKTTRHENKARKKANNYAKIEYILVILFFIITFWRFNIETWKEKKRLGDKFSFIKFFMGTNTIDEKKQNYASNRSEGRCKKYINKEIIKEINEGIKNSIWTKFKNKIKKMLK